jgi:hypothetical protein
MLTPQTVMKNQEIQQVVVAKPYPSTPDQEVQAQELDQEEPSGAVEAAP